MDKYISLEDYKGTNIEKSYKKSGIDSLELSSLRNTVNYNFDKDLISEQEFCKANDDIDLLAKGKKANPGEIREWHGARYQKQGSGKWKMIGKVGKKKTNKESLTGKKSPLSYTAVRDTIENNKKDFIQAYKKDGLKGMVDLYRIKASQKGFFSEVSGGIASDAITSRVKNVLDTDLGKDFKGDKE